MNPAHRKTGRERHRRRLRLSRDSVLFLAGLTGVAHETLVAQADRPTLLLLFGAMIGLPAFLRHDEKNDTRVALKETILSKVTSREKTNPENDRETPK